MQMIGTSIITALMEYATTVKFSDVGLPWEIHISNSPIFRIYSYTAKRVQVRRTLKKIFS